MRKIVLAIFICSLSFTAMSQTGNKESLLRHVVLFKFKDTASEAGIKKVQDAFRVLPQQIKTIKDFEWGTNSSPEKLNDGFTHCFFVSFTSEKDRNDYLPNPAHQAFVEVLKPYLDKVLVIDYWTKK